ncbi:hypothetical protein Skr01_40300 [Sphaerisporangium krabiense]|nr:hypothetical protein Skr01_40300 [Sphaerisporangium krabiense]
MTSATRPPRKEAGRPPVCPPEVVVRVRELRDQGLSLKVISEVLNSEGVPTPMGRAPWGKSHVDRLLHTQHARQPAHLE